MRWPTRCRCNQLKLSKILMNTEHGQTELETIWKWKEWPYNVVVWRNPYKYCSHATTR
jgi:hypothetical protein